MSPTFCFLEKWVDLDSFIYCSVPTRWWLYLAWDPLVMVLLVPSTNDIYPSAYLNNGKFIHRNKTSTNSYIQVFILYWWCVLHVMKAFWCFFHLRRQQTLTYKFSFSTGGVYCMLWKLSDVFFSFFFSCFNGSTKI